MVPFKFTVTKWVVLIRIALFSWFILSFDKTYQRSKSLRKYWKVQMYLLYVQWVTKDTYDYCETASCHEYKYKRYVFSFMYR